MIEAPPAPRVRFAPSPTGSLHLGNARTALFNWLVARRLAGTVIVRIEDTDVARGQEGSEASILEDLSWLGLGWDEGPETGGPDGPYRQSERLALYAGEGERLLAAGRAYRCFCTDAVLEQERAAQQGSGMQPGYSGRCRGLDPARSEARARAGEAFAIRFRTLSEAGRSGEATVVFQDRLRGPIEVAAAQLGDPVLLRRDGRPTYNFAVVVDDTAMRVSLVIRGDDHLSNTPVQVLLYRALDRPVPEFAHLPMVLGPDGERLSKRHGATSVAEYRKQGYPPEALLNALVLLGWAPAEDRTILTLDEMVAGFDLDRVGRSPAVFDPVKTDWISSQHIQRMRADRLASEVGRWLTSAGLLPQPLPEAAKPWLLDLVKMLRTSLERLDQVPARTAPLFAGGGEPGTPEAALALRGEAAARVLEALAREAGARPPGSREAWREVQARVTAETGAKGRTLFHPIRAALTGQASGAELDHLVPLMVRGHDLVPDRIPSVAQRVVRTLAWMARHATG